MPRGKKRTARKAKLLRRRPTAPRSRDEHLPASFINRLRRDIDGFRRLSPEAQHDLAYLAWTERTWSRRHSFLDGYMSIDYRELEHRFGRKGFAEANDAVRMFEVTSQWWKGKAATRGYKLTEQTAAIKAAYLHESHPRLTHLIQNDGKRLRTIPDAIAAKDVTGRTQTFWRGAKIVNKVRVDIERLRLLYARLVALRDDLQAGRGSRDLYVTADLENVRYHCDMLAEFLRMTRTTAAGIGYVPMRYIVGRTGRLYARGTSLQNVPRLVRKVALNDLWDYDIENCHYAIFRQMAARYRFEAQAVAAYLADKRTTRQGIANRVGIGVEQAKACLLAIMYGARRSGRGVDAIPLIVGGRDVAERLYADPAFVDLLRDIRDGREIILSRHPKRPTTMLNAVSLAIRLDEPPEDQLAHLIQGVEAQALRAAQATSPSHIVLLMHDGWVADKRLDRAHLATALKAATGYEFEISEERVTVPADLDLTNLQ